MRILFNDEPMQCADALTVSALLTQLNQLTPGVALALNVDVVVPFIERLLGTELMSKEVYYISDLPSDLQWGDVWGVTLIAFVLALLATIYPSWRASRVNPAEALRYE